jgi:hypothetical protein
LGEAVIVLLRQKHDGDLDQQTAELTAQIVMSVADFQTRDQLMGALQDRRDLAQQGNDSGRTQVGIAVCEDLTSGLTAFLASSDGARLLEKIRDDPSGFEAAHRQELGPDVAPTDVVSRAIEDFAGQAPIRQAVYRAYGPTPDIPENQRAAWAALRETVSRLVVRLLTAACINGLGKQAFDDRLHQLAI